MINVAIIDDEYYARESLKDLIHEMSDFNIVGCYESIEEFMKKSKNNEIHVIFLDIELPKMNGIKAAKYLNQHKIVFVTAYSEYAVDAFEVNALDYITKPVSEERFIETINRIKQLFTNTENKTTKLAVEDEKEIIFLDFKDIYYFEFFDKTIHVFTFDNEYILKHFRKFSELSKNLPKNFVRIHKSYIVNLDYIEKYIKELSSLELKNKKILPIGKTYLRHVKKILNL